MDLDRRIDLLRATAIGVGAIVGGGILALVGSALAVTGPSAILAFALNGVIALLTAMSFAEVSTKFPQSGGTYVFAKKVLSVEAAFVVGWVVWFASIVAAVLYALGFGQFAAVTITELCRLADVAFLDSVPQTNLIDGLSLLGVFFYTAMLLVKPAGGGLGANVSKLLVFGILIVAGIWAMRNRSLSELHQSMQPFFAGGAGGLFQAMGFTFIALQGFDLIAAVAGDIRQPDRTIPRAMFGSLGIALLIYIPLLLVIPTVGIPQGESIQAVSQKNSETIVAIAAQNYLGSFGYWAVLVAGLLSMLSALEANLYAASRVAMSMSKDHTLPAIIGSLSAARRIPRVAVLTTSAIVITLIFVLPDLSAAGAAASLIFLITFALAHGIAVLVRTRSRDNPPPYRTPWFPLVPLIGGTACLLLAVYQGWAVPAAGWIVGLWISGGVLLFLALFARRARLADVSAAALDPEIVKLRGRSPLVLVPVANPDNAPGLITLADALTPPHVGRVLLLSVIAPRSEEPSGQLDAAMGDSFTVLRTAITAATHRSRFPESLVTVAARPWEEIARVAKAYRCESLLVGLSRLMDNENRMPLDELLNRVECDIVVLRAPHGWQIGDASRILIPTTGRGLHDRLLVRLLSSIHRNQAASVRFLRVLSASHSESRRFALEQSTRRYADSICPGSHDVSLMLSDSAEDIVVQEAIGADLVILGVQRTRSNEKLIGRFVQHIAKRTQVPILIISCSC